MYNLGEGTYIIKYNPVYAIGDLPTNQGKPSQNPVIRWQWYKTHFKTIYPYPRP